MDPAAEFAADRPTAPSGCYQQHSFSPWELDDDNQVSLLATIRKPEHYAATPRPPSHGQNYASVFATPRRSRCYNTTPHQQWHSESQMPPYATPRRPRGGLLLEPTSLPCHAPPSLSAFDQADIRTAATPPELGPSLVRGMAQGGSRRLPEIQRMMRPLGYSSYDPDSQQAKGQLEPQHRPAAVPPPPCKPEKSGGAIPSNEQPTARADDTSRPSSASPRHFQQQQEQQEQQQSSQLAGFASLDLLSFEAQVDAAAAEAEAGLPDGDGGPVLELGMWIADGASKMKIPRDSKTVREWLRRLTMASAVLAEKCCREQD